MKLIENGFTKEILIAQNRLTFYFGKDKRYIQFALKFDQDHLEAMDLGYHSPVPMYEGCTPVKGKCRLTDGICYYDCGILRADNLLLQCKNGYSSFNESLMWDELKSEWENMFGESNNETN
jgi:hypothetical protein